MSLVASSANKNIRNSPTDDAHNQSVLAVTEKLPPLPVEIWLKILRLHLGPSSSNPRQDSIYAYQQTVFLKERDAACRYLEKERIRTPLRLVCRAWKAILDVLDDALLASRLDDFDWPPTRTKSHAKTIYYSWDEHQSYWEENPIQTYRTAKGVAYRNRLQQDRDLQIDNHLPLSPTTVIIDYDIHISPTYDSDQPLLAFEWWARPVLKSLHTLSHPVFSNLLALSLDIGYPFSWQDDCQEFALSQLRYLDLTLYRGRQQTGSTKRIISTWRFPKLSLLRVAPFCESAREESLELVRAHAGQIEEIYASNLGDEFPTRHDWQSFGSLRLVVFDSLCQMIAALSSVEVLWMPASNGILRDRNQTRGIERRLTMSFQHPRTPVQSDGLSVLGAFDTYRHTISHLDFAMASTWQAVRDSLIPVFAKPLLHTAMDTFKLMEKLGVDFVDPDGHGLDSDEFRRLKNAIAETIHELDGNVD